MVVSDMNKLSDARAIVFAARAARRAVGSPTTGLWEGSMRDFRSSDTDIGDHVFRKLGIFVRLDEIQDDVFKELLADPLSVNADSEIVVEGEPYRYLYLLAKGWAVRYKLVPDGRRQILGFLIPGDFFGLRATLFDVADDSVQTLTDCTVCRIPGEKFVKILQEHPRLGMAVVWSVVREYSVLAEHVVRLGRRSAYERTSHLLMELLKRLQLIRLAGEKDFELPLTQEILADTLGLSIVHVNRTLRRLRSQGLIKLNPQTRWITIDDPERLAEVAGFEAAYLDQDTPPAANLLEAIKSNH